MMEKENLRNKKPLVTIEAVHKDLTSREDYLEEVEGIGIFGSLARGDFSAERSDIDIFVVLGKATYADDELWIRRIKDLLVKYERDITVLVYDLGSLKKVCNWYVLELASDSILVYDKGKVKYYFDKIIEAAKKADLIRMVYNRHPIWGLGRPAAPGEVIRVEVRDD
jgi:predicted nucleotidyltransferase